jgi:ribonucleotide reductase beta subunit family protein with ferritin-like domain
MLPGAGVSLATRFGSKNSFPWMSETIDLGKEKNFFETRVTEYQAGGALEWQPGTKMRLAHRTCWETK